MASIEVKKMSSSSQTRMHVTVSVFEKCATYCLRVCLRRKRAASGYRNNFYVPATFSRRLFAPFRTRKRAAYVGLRHMRMNASADLRHARMNASAGL